MTMMEEAITVGRAPVLGGIDLVGARFITHCSPRHMHPECEIGVVVTGQRLVRCRGREFRAPEGSIVVFAPREVHAGAPLDAAGSTYRSFLVAGDASGWAPLRSPVLHDPELAGRLVRTHVSMEAGMAGPAVEAELLGTFQALWQRHADMAPSPVGHEGNPRAVALVRGYLEEHFAEKVRLELLAALAGLSVFHLIRVFRTATGLTPYAYLEHIRVHQAAQMLRAGTSVSVVACRTGFADQSHLTRMFKRLMGIPPGRYQRSALRAAG